MERTSARREDLFGVGILAFEIFSNFERIGNIELRRWVVCCGAGVMRRSVGLGRGIEQSIDA